MENFSMTPEELKKLIDTGSKVRVLDVREPDEYRIANIGGTLIPLGDLGRRFTELNPDEEIVVLCHHGVRSSHAVSFLRSHGFEKVKNLSGGIERWSLTIDPSVPRY
jgi:sulfur-carrier protein adenylyltransferase/sulfurtransferase